MSLLGRGDVDAEHAVRAIRLELRRCGIDVAAFDRGCHSLDARPRKCHARDVPSFVSACGGLPHSRRSLAALGWCFERRFACRGTRDALDRTETTCLMLHSSDVLASKIACTYRGDDELANLKSARPGDADVRRRTCKRRLPFGLCARGRQRTLVHDDGGYAARRLDRESGTRLWPLLLVRR